MDVNDELIPIRVKASKSGVGEAGWRKINRLWTETTGRDREAILLTVRNLLVWGDEPMHPETEDLVAKYVLSAGPGVLDAADALAFQAVKQPLRENSIVASGMILGDGEWWARSAIALYHHIVLHGKSVPTEVIGQMIKALPMEDEFPEVWGGCQALRAKARFDSKSPLTDSLRSIAQRKPDDYLRAFSQVEAEADHDIWLALKRLHQSIGPIRHGPGGIEMSGLKENAPQAGTIIRRPI